MDDIARSGGFLAIVRPARSPGGLVARAVSIESLPEEIFVVVHATGGVTGYCGHVDLGTGIRTALAQIVSEELDVPFGDVAMVLGHTGETPNQGATIASETIQVSAVPLRKAAAHARAVLLDLAADRTGRPAAELDLRDGLVVSDLPLPDNAALTYGMLLHGQALRVQLDEDIPVKSPDRYRVVGRTVPRVDIPDKVTGRAVYVHDVRVAGMLHGRVVRPPYGGFDHGPFVGRSLRQVHRASVAHLPGLVDVVVIGDFVGVVAEREEQAAEAARLLHVVWDVPDLPDLSDLEGALLANPATPRRLLDRGDVDAALDGPGARMDRTYLWPYQMHGSIGPSCAVADWRADGLTLWSGTQNPHMLRADIALLADLPEERISIIRHEAAGCYGRNCADDVCGDAMLLSRAVGRPVRVQLTREQEHVWEPKGAAQLMQVRGGITPDGVPAAYDFSTRYPSNVSPLLGLVLTGTVPAAVPSVVPMGDRTCIPPYAYDNARVTVHDMPPIARASWFRGVSAMPNSFAHECYVDELAAAAGVDPVEYRLRYLKDARAAELLRAVARRADWAARTAPVRVDPAARVLRGRGVAYAQYVHGTFPGVPAAWAAWVTDVAVDRQTGHVTVTRVVVGQDSGMMVNPAGVRHQIHGNVIQSTSRALREEVSFDDSGVASREWGGYPLITFPEVPDIDVLMLDRPDQPPLGVGESASVPGAAAIANALYDATGVRFRELPFTPDRIRAGLDAALGPLPAPEPEPLPQPMPARPAPMPALARPRLWTGLAALGTLCSTIGGLAVTASPWRPEIAPIARPDPRLFSAETIARGRALAAAGDCAVCHTAPGGAANAGGLELDTPFGIIRTTNITPDEETGIGRWSYPAFARAMREGIGRDGRHLYPAFPYTAFAKITEPDMEALYAYLMAQQPVRNVVPETKLAFPYNIRPMMAGWNVLYHDPRPFAPDPARSVEWNRGAYLAEGLGHCGACHTPRNALGAERWKRAYLDGGEAEGWDAPALSALSRSPLPWTADELFTYLRTGFSDRHGPAAGPMAPVVAEMARMPEADVRAIAAYVASFDTRETTGDLPAGNLAERIEDAAAARQADAAWAGQGARVYGGSCAACHEGQQAHMFGARPSLALNTNVAADRPDNLVRVILDGIAHPATPGVGAMPAFRDSLTDGQIVDLVRHIRATFAPGRPAWDGVAATVARLRAAPSHAAPHPVLP
ncbi:molybdopterin-dependent oxidoreductase [Gluconacetobacter azotocaptans]|uniref:Molybdopterin-dependent oxidoreductase n=1 Tax=Gluconacetobacter azotocaptans TaxID=142834 RepID=A0A7W4PDQ6_9PROT|nr:molybdopterin cofactor-binding domain-containing protein [Gluconacetobacter azotocaptans]MBB2188609.1 molybdopterin-dependent oxidoreductase [Gluconacetobacter azotocaptans]